MNEKHHNNYKKKTIKFLDYLHQGSPIFSQVGPNLISSRSWWAAKSYLRKSCSDFLVFVPKFRCSLEKKRFSSIFLLRFLNFGPKFRCSLKKKSFPKISSYRFPPQMSFSNLAELFRVTFVTARKLEIVAGPHQNLKWAAG